MRNLLIVSMIFKTATSFGQVDSVEVDKKKLDSLLVTIEKDKRKFDILEDTFSEKDLIFKPIIDELGLHSIEVKQGDRLLWIYLIDSKSYKIKAEIDWR